jgi:hypothetical protein
MNPYLRTHDQLRLYGISKETDLQTEYHKLLEEAIRLTDGDEDFDGSDGIYDWAVKKNYTNAIKLLNEYITRQKSQQSQQGGYEKSNLIKKIKTSTKKKLTTKANAKTNMKANTKTNTKANTKANTKTNMKANTKKKLTTKANTKTNTKKKPTTKANAKTNSKTNTKSTKKL